MSATFVLRPEIRLVPVSRLAAEVRAGLPDADPGAYVLVRDHSRAPSSLVDAEAAALIRQFMEPRSLTEAVLRYSLPRGLDPSATLDESYRMLASLIAAEDLLEAGRAPIDPVRATLSDEDEIAGFRVVRCLRLLDDSEVYAVQSGDRRAALKLARDDGAFGARGVLRETAALAALAGVAGPTLLAYGLHRDRPYVVSAWVDGLDMQQAANLLRGDDQEMLDLLLRVADAYVLIHDLGVLHGDVHPANLLDAGARIAVIDLGLADVPGLAGPERGGAGPYADPELARALLAGSPPPPLTPAAEQYSVAAVLYSLVTGANHQSFSWDREQMLRQITEQGPVPFAQQGRTGWPELEAVLTRALSQEPSRRYPSMLSFRVALGGVAAPAPRPVREPRRSLVDTVLAEVGFDGPWLSGTLLGPAASVSYGAAGVALGLSRMASAGFSAELLALADAWSLRSVALAHSSTAFANADLDIGPATVGLVAPLHCRSGVHAVRVLVDVARGDSTAVKDGVWSFITSTAAPCEELDATLGLSAVLLTQAMLLEATGLPALAEAGAATHDEIVRRLEAGAQFAFLGVAHGIAGVLYALLRWYSATGQPVPADCTRRLYALASLGRRESGAARWPVHSTSSGPVTYASGWCHGSAGYVHLWILAARILGRADLLDLAEQAGRAAGAARPANPSLCCGLAGQAYSQLALYRATGDETWLAAALDLAAAAEEVSTPRRLSLYKGEFGVAVLRAELEAPAQAVMPLFGVDD